MPEVLTIGTIVKVNDGEYIHHKLEGQVVGFKEIEGETFALVWFGRESDYILDHRDHKKLYEMYSVTPPPPELAESNPRTWEFEAFSLTVISEWSLPTLAARYFQNMWHSYATKANEFVAGAEECEVEGCPNKTSQRVLFNIWGTVLQADVCDTCAPKYHLKCGESFPWRAPEPPPPQTFYTPPNA